MPVETDPRLRELADLARPDWAVVEWEAVANADFFPITGGRGVIGKPVHRITVAIQRVNQRLAGTNINRLRLEAESMSPDEAHAMIADAVRGLTRHQ